MTEKIKLTIKQTKARDYLFDKTTETILFWWWSWWWKSDLMCLWLLNMCESFPGTRYLLWRAVLKRLKESTLLSFFDISKKIWYKRNVHYKYNSIDAVITFHNESEIHLRDLYQYPADPEFESLWSTQYTWAWIDECSQVWEKAINIVSSRLRYRLDEYWIFPKLLICSNPTKKRLYKEFYKKRKEKNLEREKKFVQALRKDNPYLNKSYIERLKKLDPISKQRLFYWNREYDDDPAKLYEYDDIINIFTNPAEKWEKYITCDVARFGKDKIVIIVWNWFIGKVQYYEKKWIDETERIILDIAEKEKIKRSNILIDEDWVWWWLVDNIKWSKWFVNNSKSLLKKNDKNPKNYLNLRSQCYFELNNYLLAWTIKIDTDNIQIKNMIIEELEQIKQKDIDKDWKLSIIQKDIIKEAIWRSPDFADTIMMRMRFELQPKKSLIFQTI